MSSLEMANEMAEMIAAAKLTQVLSTLSVILFILGLGWREWKIRRSGFLVKMMLHFMTRKSKANDATLSKAQRTASKTIVLNYMFNEQEYELHLPVVKRRRWTQCIAIMQNEQVSDVTEVMKRIAGPDGNFHGIKLRPEQLVRGARELQFYNKKGDQVNVL